jgi:transcriptional antiterminator RfaH
MAFEWYVAKTKPNAERAAARELNNQLFASYLPWLTVRTAHNGAMVTRREPLFRGYIFIALDLDDDPEERWKKVNSTRAVTTLLPRSDSPLPISTDEVDGLRQAELAGHFRAGDVVPGDRVKVFRGSLAEQVLECIESHGNRIRCLWSCFGALRVVEVPLANVTVLR